jgi:pSer/pThr/pTyr-binding forkhead associated (FHA) protein
MLAVADPIEVLLKFAFIGVLYLFLLWVARSALKDLRRPAPYTDSYRDADYSADDGFAGQVPSSARLVVEHGGGLRAGQAFVVGSGLVIGRADGNEIRIEDGFASGRHARVFDHDGLAYVEDMRSTNGTYLNGRRVEGQELLRPDDRIRIGDTEFRYEP